MAATEVTMPVSKKGSKEELVRDVFLALLVKWDVHDKATGRNLARHSVDIVEGYYEVLDNVYGSRKPEKPA
jgi:23S rRNA G2445 N2-methylase RlmL